MQNVPPLNQGKKPSIQLQVPDIKFQNQGFNTPSRSRIDSQESSSPMNSSEIMKSNNQISQSGSRKHSFEQGQESSKIDETGRGSKEQGQQAAIQSQTNLKQQSNMLDVLKKQKIKQNILIPKSSSRKRESKMSLNSSFSNQQDDDVSPGTGPDRQMKKNLIQQKKQQQELEDKKDKATRDNFLERLKFQFAQKNIYPLDLFCVYDDANVEFQIRTSEFELALKSIEIELNEEDNKIIQKFYKNPNKEAISTIKLCCGLVEDTGQLILVAINYIIDKYRLLPNILLEEVASQDGSISIDSLKALNKEWEWGLDEEMFSQIQTQIAGNAKITAQEFKLKLTKVPQATDSKFYQEAYVNLVKLIISDDSIVQFSQLLQDQDQASSGEVALYIFVDILSMYIDRALSKLDQIAIRVFLQKERDDEVVVYTKLLNDAIKIIEENKLISQQQTNKFKMAQLQLIQIYFNTLTDKQTPLVEQYFKVEGHSKISKDQFLELTATITGFQIDMECASLIYQMIAEEKLDRFDPSIEMGELSQFIIKRKHEMSIFEKGKQLPNQKISEDQKQEIDLAEQSQQLDQIKQNMKSLVNNKQQVLQSALSFNQQELDIKSSNKQKELNSQSQLIQISQIQDKPQIEKPNISYHTLKQDIVQFFEELDVNNVKFLSQQQMFFGLLKIGIMIRSRELFAQKSYDYYGFEKVIMAQLKLFFNSAKLIYNLTKELELYKEQDNDIVNMQLLKQLFEKVKVYVKFEDVIYIYQTLDKERSGFIKLGDFLHLLYQHPQMDYRLNELLFRMKGYHDNSLRAIRIFYHKLPFNYIRPFTERANPPSYSFHIRPNLVGKFFVEPNRSAWELCKIKIIEGEGIPSPQDKTTCFRREIIVAIYDKFYQQFIQNSTVIKATYQPEKEDVWQFPNKNRNNGFFLICENQPHKLHLIVIFELICYFTENNQAYKVSCGFAEIPVTHLMQYGTFLLPLQGGNTEQIVALNKSDIRCNRSGIAGIVAKINGDIASHLKISSSKRSRRPNLLKELEVLPELCLCHRNLTQIIYAYKRYCREKIEAGEEVLTPAINMFLFSIDCPYICRKMCKLWARTMTGKMIGQEVGAFQILIGQLQKFMKLSDFNFNPYSTQEIFTPEISKVKKNVVNSILKYTEYLIDSSFFNRLGLQGDKILQEYIDLYSTTLQLGIYDSGQNQFDKFNNGLRLKAYNNYVQQII